MEPAVSEALDRWRGTLLTDELYFKLVEHENARGPAAPPLPPPSPPAAPPVAPPVEESSRADLVAEALAYVGAALALGFGFAVFGGLWTELGGVGRVLMALVPTIVVGIAGAALGDEQRGSVRRLGMVLSALAVVGVGLTVGVLLAEGTDLREVVIVTTAGVAAFAAAVPTHVKRASWPTTLVLGASLLVSVFGTLELVDVLHGSVIVGVTLMGLGLAWAALGWSGMLRPRNAFETTGLIVGGIGVQTMSFDGMTVTSLVIGLLISAAALAVALKEERMSPAVLGGLGITVFAPQLVLHLFEDTLGAPLAIFVAGITLVAVSVIILRQKVSS